jgi:hypothetical protein
MSIDFAILAPVPAEHLDAGLTVLSSRDYVSYGSQKFNLFHDVDHLRTGEAVPILIYPSHEDDIVKVTYQITWVAEYIGHVQDYAAKADDERNGHRPETTERYRHRGDSATGWAVFWRVRKLRQLPSGEHLIIAMLDSYRQHYWRKNSPPRGPEIVSRPAGI